MPVYREAVKWLENEAVYSRAAEVIYSGRFDLRPSTWWQLYIIYWRFSAFI